MRACIKVKRVYEEPAPDDGMRVLVDRLWPRGLSKESARVDLWLKSIAPSKDLRQWFAHDPEKWSQFKRRYFAELDHNEEAVEALVSCLHRNSTLSLLFAAKTMEHNNAVALKEYLLNKVR